MDFKSKGFVSAEDLGMPQLDEKQLKQIAKKLSKEAEGKTQEEIEMEVARTLASNPNY